MKKIIAIAISLLSLSFAATAAEAKTPPKFPSKIIVRPVQPQFPFGNGQWGRRNGGDDRNDRRFDHIRTRTESRIVRYGRHAFRDTYLITTWPNGRTESKLISRVRIG